MSITIYSPKSIFILRHDYCIYKQDEYQRKIKNKIDKSERLGNNTPMQTQKLKNKKHPQICISCGKHFKSKYRTKNYCSIDCYIRFNKKQQSPVYASCRNCGKQFIKKGAAKHCPGCIKAGLVIVLNQYKSSNLFATCSACDKPDWLVVHHKDFNPDNNKPSNKEYICKTCHFLRHKIHKSKRPKWKRIDVERSFHHFNQRYSDKGGVKNLAKNFIKR